MSESITAETRDWLALHLVPGLGPKLTTALLKRFGSVAAILQARPNELSEVPHIGDKLAHQLHEAMQRIDLSGELDLLAKHNTSVRVLGSPEYPQSLASIGDPPQLLYVCGSLLPQDAKAVALVGSRSCTGYGKRAAERLAKGLVQAGYTIISGLARGIDGVAHRAALEAGGRTIGVLAGGLSRIYPPEHTDLAKAISQSGALLSESGMRMEPMAGMFPARNRIISALSKAVVIVEAADRSGALITASHAGEQGRPIMAVPGPIDALASGGANDLIRKGAILVRGVEDILEEIEGVSRKERPSNQSVAPPAGMDELQTRIWEALGDGPCPLDTLVHKLGTPVAQLTATLFALEMKKVVRRLTGNRYERT
ncbi:MAG TPA: DNA-processing protein DprA [Gemmataceae bacterium]|nr:DNA-processing protein DprA [Gemmataceae bacterium]